MPDESVSWKTPRTEIDSGLFTVRAAAQPTAMDCAAQQSGVRASPVEVRKVATIRQRGRAFIRNATSMPLRATRYLALDLGFHARGRVGRLMNG